MTTEAQIEIQVDKAITRFRTTIIRYYPYVSSSTDIYKQATKSFGTPVELIGRAILSPTFEQVTMIGNGETFDLALLFSRLELVRKFPSAEEGKWLSATGQMEWRSDRYKIERAAPSGQVGVHFSLFIVLANSLLGVSY